MCDGSFVPFAVTVALWFLEAGSRSSTTPTLNSKSDSIESVSTECRTDADETTFHKERCREIFYCFRVNER